MREELSLVQPMEGSCHIDEIGQTSRTFFVYVGLQPVKGILKRYTGIQRGIKKC